MSKRSQPRYPIALRWSDEDEAWIAEVPDLPGCVADGPTEVDAIREAEKAIRLWLDVAKQEGREIPSPSVAPPASGKFVVRVPRSLHHRLQVMARQEGVSLNQLVAGLLAAREAEKRSQGDR